jgi:hypothetical protein
LVITTVLDMTSTVTAKGLDTDAMVLTRGEP